MAKEQVIRRIWREAVIAAALAAATATAVFAATPREGSNLLDEPAAPDVELRPGPTATPGAPRVRNEPRPPSGNPLWEIPLSTLTATRDRPIFSPSRRPPAPPATPQAPTAAAPSPPQPATDKLALTLVGTIAAQDEGIAILLEAGSKEPIRLRVGESHNGWVLREVRSRSASLAKGSSVEAIEMQRLEPSKDGPQPGLPAPSPPAAPPQAAAAPPQAPAQALPPRLPPRTPPPPRR